MSHWCWSRGHDSFGTWLIPEVCSPWLVERDFNRTEWATTQVSVSPWFGKLNIFLNKEKCSPRDVHWSGSQCLVPQGAVPSWLPPGAILFPLAARNCQWLYQGGVKYPSAVHLSKTLIWFLHICIKIYLQVMGGSPQLFLDESLEDVCFRKEGRQTKGRPTSLTPEIANIHVSGSLPMPPLIPLRS